MNNSDQQMIYELAKEYTFKNFDFGKSPKELLIFFQETKKEISEEIERQNAEIADSINQVIYQNY